MTIRRNDESRSGIPAWLAFLVLSFGVALHAGAQTNPVDCEGPVSDAEPGTPGWYARDLNNVFCAEQRHLDKALHPVTALPLPQAANDPAMALDAYERLTAEVFDDSADVHNVSMGFFDRVRFVTSGDPLYGGNAPYMIEGLWTTDRLATDFRSYCSVSVPDYLGGSDGSPFSAVVARADTGNPSGSGPANDMRIHGCPEVE